MLGSGSLRYYNMVIGQFLQDIFKKGVRVVERLLKIL